MGLSVKKPSQTQALKNRYGFATSIVTGTSISATSGTEKTLYKTFYLYRNLSFKQNHTNIPISMPFQEQHNITKRLNPSITRRKALKKLTGITVEISANIVSQTLDIVFNALCTLFFLYM